MNTIYSSPTASELTVFQDQFIAAAQDVRGKADLFTTADMLNMKATRTVLTKSEYAAPLAEGSRYSTPDPMIPQFQSRVLQLKDYDGLRLESDFSQDASPLDKFANAASLLLSSLSLTKDIIYVASAKGRVQIELTRTNPQAPSSTELTAEEDGIIRIDAVGGTAPQGKVLAVTLEDFLSTTEIHANRNTGNPVGLAGGSGMQALKGMPFVFWSSFDRGDLKSDAANARAWGDANFQSMINNAYGTSANSNSIDLIEGYPCVVCGAVAAITPVSILDAGCDSIIIDNGDGTYDIERDIIFSTSEAVSRGMMTPAFQMKENPNKPVIKNFTLNIMLGGVRTRGESLVFLRTQRTLIDRFELSNLEKGYTIKSGDEIRLDIQLNVVNGKEHAIKKLERLERRGIDTDEFTNSMGVRVVRPLIKKLKKLADGKDFETKSPIQRFYGSNAPASLAASAPKTDKSKNK